MECVILGAGGMMPMPLRMTTKTIHASSVSFDETTAAIDAAFASSALVLHASHDVRVPEEKHRAKVYVITSPTYAKAAKAESARTVSAQVLRLAVYTLGDEQKTYINIANPVAHAMVFYADSPNYDDLVAAAGKAAAQEAPFESTGID